MNELLAGKAPKKQVLVAIIDNGIDTSHVDLKANLWVNPKETPGNHKDDDTTDSSTTSTAGTSSAARTGKDVHFDTFEVTREYARCHGGAAASGSPKITDAARCAEMTAAFEKQRNQIQSSVTNYKGALDVLHQITPLLKQAVAPDTLSTARVRALSPTTPQLTQARQIYLQLADEGATEPVLADGLKSLEGQLKNGLNPDFNPRTIVGDNYTDWHEHHYGNSDVMGQDAKHGTHVAGIIGAVRGNGIGVDGIAPVGHVHDDSHGARRRRARQGRRQRDPLRRGQRRADHQHELRQGVLAVQGRCRRRGEIRRRARAC